MSDDTEKTVTNKLLKFIFALQFDDSTDIGDIAYVLLLLLTYVSSMKIT